MINAATDEDTAGWTSGSWDHWISGPGNWSLNCGQEAQGTQGHGAVTINLTAPSAYTPDTGFTGLDAFITPSGWSWGNCSSAGNRANRTTDPTWLLLSPQSVVSSRRCSWSRILTLDPEYCYTRKLTGHHEGPTKFSPVPSTPLRDNRLWTGSNNRVQCPMQWTTMGLYTLGHAGTGGALLW